MILTPSFMGLISGLPAYKSELALKRIERRVRGGYLNRWLIREVTLVPSIIVTAHAIYVHPARWVAFIEATS